MNENRIVRIRNKRMHQLVAIVADATQKPYQHVFEALCDCLEEDITIAEVNIGMLSDAVQTRKR